MVTTQEMLALADHVDTLNIAFGTNALPGYQGRKPVICVSAQDGNTLSASGVGGSVSFGTSNIPIITQ